MSMKDRIAVIKGIRKEAYKLLNNVSLEQSEMFNTPGGREVSLAYTKLQEARMWLGQALGALGNELPEEYQDK